MSIAVEVKDLIKRYGNLAAVDKVSFSIREGEIFGLLGPNGAGKTTTIEMIEGLRKPDAGSVRVCDIEIPKGADKLKEIIGVQLQSTSVYERIRVAEVIDLFGGYYYLPAGIYAFSINSERAPFLSISVFVALLDMHDTHIGDDCFYGSDFTAGKRIIDHFYIRVIFQDI